jgi:dCMP deaminase
VNLIVPMDDIDRGLAPIINMKPKFINLYMNIADVVSKTSSATRLKVGAVAVKDHRILAASYNGTPPGFDNCCEIDGKTRPEVIHAEQNLIYRMARDGQSSLDADIFITTAPCIECAKAIKTSGFKKVWFRDHYRDDSGVKFLIELGVEVEQV